MLKRFAVALVTLGLTAGIWAVGAPARAQGGVQVGVLTCNVASGWGFVSSLRRRAHGMSDLPS